MSDVQSVEIVVGKTDDINVYHKGQDIYYINILDNVNKSQSYPSERMYDNSDIDFSILLDYYPINIAGENISPHQGLMPVYVSPYQTIDLFKKEVTTKTGTNTIYSVFKGDRSTWSLSDAQNYSTPLYYISPLTNQYKSIQNFNQGTDIRSGQDGTFTRFYPVLYTREQIHGEVVDRSLTALTKVKSDIQDYTFRDFNITTGRKYQYVFYPVSDGDILIREDKIISTKWDSWSITELHPVDSTKKNYYASDDDVWVFNLNVETGEQTQNLSKSENITLGSYPRYSQGRQNRISGQVTCLMGTDVVPLTYLEYGTATSFSPCVRNGYTEARFFNTHPSSNEKVDMLKKWRQLVFSKNPKLLKDRKGQSFIVTITQSSNKPYDNVKGQPDTISFSWSEIQSLDGVTITDIK